MPPTQELGVSRQTKTWEENKPFPAGDDSAAARQGHPGWGGVWWGGGQSELMEGVSVPVPCPPPLAVHYQKAASFPPADLYKNDDHARKRISHGSAGPSCCHGGQGSHRHHFLLRLHASRGHQLAASLSMSRTLIRLQNTVSLTMKTPLSAYAQATGIVNVQ